VLSQGELPALRLRERKKARTRAAIQRHALRLFREQGYQATTVSQIAEAAEVSESTFFRYFPTKEDVVLQDDLDDALVAAFEGQPAELSPVQAMRAAISAVFGNLSSEDLAELHDRNKLVFSVPELRAAAIANIVETLQRTSELLAARVGRRPDDLAVRTFAGAMLGAMIAVSVTALDDPSADYVELIDTAMRHLEAGLPL
jgi:AcrR family transcriptional regulator